jgi:hypothetical protein
MARADGKPKMVSERYLGSAEDIEAAMAGSVVVPDRTRHLTFGAVAAGWAVQTRLRVIDIVDQVVGPQRADAGASVGTYLALAALNRLVDPCSRRSLADWWAATAADRFTGIRMGVLEHSVDRCQRHRSAGSDHYLVPSGHARLPSSLLGSPATYGRKVNASGPTTKRRQRSPGSMAPYPM